MYFAFHDHINNEIEFRFPGDQRQMTVGQYLIHSKFDYLVDSVIYQLPTMFSYLETSNSQMENVIP